ncbi:MAG: hypothetical protein LCH78_17945 [Proteobacteria bacterium]|nr:hypothetical protein [Pseudomonadota bacterium]
MKLSRTIEERRALELAKKVKERESQLRARERSKHRREAKEARKKDPMSGQRQPREHDKPFLAYLRRQPCAAAHLGGCNGPIEAAHIRYSDAAAGARNPGMQAKNHDRHANPLCHAHHQHDQHKRRERDFWSALGVDAYANAARHYARFLAGDAE